MGWRDFWATVIGDLLTFGSTSLGHFLSWPVVVFVIVVMLHKPIKRLIGRLRTAEGLGSKWQFAIDEIQENNAVAAEEVSIAVEQRDDEKQASDGTAGATAARSDPALSLRLTPQLQHPGPEALRGVSPVRLISLNNREPRDAVLTSWASMRGKLVALHAHFNGEQPRAKSTRKILADLSESPHISEAFINAVLGLYDLRSRVMHQVIDPDRRFSRAYVGSVLATEKIADALLAIDPTAPPAD